MKLMRLKDVICKTGLGRSTIYKFMAEGQFPKAVPLGGRAVAWVEQEIDDWITGRVALRGGLQ